MLEDYDSYRRGAFKSYEQHYNFPKAFTILSEFKKKVWCMKILRSVVRSYHNNGLLVTFLKMVAYSFAKFRAMFLMLFRYYLNPFIKKGWPSTDIDTTNLQIVEAEINLENYDVNINDFKKWLNQASYPKNYKESYGKIFIEKALEHYLSMCFIDKKDDIVIIDYSGPQK